MTERLPRYWDNFSKLGLCEYFRGGGDLLGFIAENMDGTWFARTPTAVVPDFESRTAAQLFVEENT